MKTFCVETEWPDPFAYGNCYEKFYFDAESEAEATQKAIENIMCEDDGPSSANEVKVRAFRVTWK